MIARDELLKYLNTVMEPAKIKDYCPNGLQVQGRDQIGKIVSGVTASKALIEEAIARKADAILVHHGWFWKSDDPVVVGQFHARLKLLMTHDINLLAYHLPLDIHPTLGNNAQLAKAMSWRVRGQATFPGLQDGLLWYGEPESSTTLEQLGRSISARLGRDPQVVGDLSRPIRSIAWCTGAAQNYINEALLLKVDAYISGEISEQTFHVCQEMGIAYIAAGHHATERYGVSALGDHLQTSLGLEHQFVDLFNPV
mgnify:FL=1